MSKTTEATGEKQKHPFEFEKQHEKKEEYEKKILIITRTRA